MNENEIENNKCVIIKTHEQKPTIPRILMDAGEALSHTEFRVAVVLWAHASDPSEFTRVDRNIIADKVGVVKETLSRYYKRLEKMGLIKRKTKAKRTGYGIYLEIQFAKLDLWWSKTGKKLKEQNKAVKKEQWKEAQKKGSKVLQEKYRKQKEEDLELSGKE